ncbi:MAG TPA: 1-deoxy-D-xylulose-5-phosphate synthase N-terminal domain-containing protein, partial [Planctomycetota bacterium]|nr:1-deoxy-D-xylulose-5-phosphate synthase N-terminal domain-containing protein [Planctomycetota bacterium]
MTAGHLVHAPRAELERILSLPADRVMRARIFAAAARLNTLYMIKRAGSGHIGSSFSSLDIVSWIHLHGLRRTEDGASFHDVYFSSKGHDVPGLYSVLLGLGLLDFDLIHRLRRLDGLPGHPDVGTPHIPTNTGSLGMGISKARGMILADRLRGVERRVFVLTGDGELEEGQFWESLQPTANRRIEELTVIVDHNKLQSDTWVEKVSPLGGLQRKLEAFGWRVERIDGHDMAAIDLTLSRSATPGEAPRLIIADTVKGRGVSFMEAFGREEKFYRFHSGAPSDDDYLGAVEELLGEADRLLAGAGAEPLQLEREPLPPQLQPAGPRKMVAAYTRALLREAERDERIVALDADLVLDTGLGPFAERFPGRFFECGIAEQDMVSQAGGMALHGLLPIVHSFACFLSARPNEQIYNNATERTKVIYVGSLAGLVPGGPGHSHQCVRDISALAAMPGMLLLEPATEAEVEALVSFCIHRTPHSAYIRLVSVPWSAPFELPAGHEPVEGRGVAITEG